VMKGAQHARIRVRRLRLSIDYAALEAGQRQRGPVPTLRQALDDVARIQSPLRTGSWIAFASPPLAATASRCGDAGLTVSRIVA
jgi:hypothetical protein